MYDYRQAIEDIMRQEVESGRIAGAGYLLIQGGRERYFGTCGYADRERQLPISRDTIFRLFSMTKPITAAAVLLLQDRGGGWICGTRWGSTCPASGIRRYGIRRGSLCR